MKQCRGTSFLKSCVSTGVGFAVAYIANMLIMPLFGLELTHSANFVLTCIYTVISIARGYALERLFEAMGWRARMSAFALAVLAERQRQIHGEGWSAEHDDDHKPGDLARAGAGYAADARRWLGDPMLERPPLPSTWPWGYEWWKPAGFRRDLVKGAALILAEGERFDRQRKRKPAVTDDRPRQRSGRLEPTSGAP